MGEWQDIGFHMCIWMQVKIDDVFLVHYSYSHEAFIFYLKKHMSDSEFYKIFHLKNIFITYEFELCETLGFYMSLNIVNVTA
jgi:hypothetical protein